MKEDYEKQSAVLKDAINKNEEQTTQLFRNREDIQKEFTGNTIQDYVQMADTATQAAQSIVSAFQAQAEKEIEVRQRRVDRAKEIADRGNAEALQEEEKRLDKAVKIKERFAKQQIAINLLMQASQIALAIATAAGETGIAAPVGIAIVLAALAAGFSAVKNFDAESTPAFKDGVIGFNGKGTGTSDSNLVRISNGESVITADATQKNRDILEEINKGAEFRVLKPISSNIQPVNSNPYDFSRLENEIKNLKEDIKTAISGRTPNTVTIDKRGFIAMAEEAKTIERKRKNL